jgi:hypothetical protein
MDHGVRPRQRGPEIATRREVAADAAGAGAAPRHLADRVARRPQRFHEALSEATGSTGDEYVHEGSLASRSAGRDPLGLYLICEIT